MRAASAGSLPLLELLVSYGAEINAASKWEGTAVTYAAGAGQVEALRWLSAQGADLHDPAALRAAARHNHLPAARFLQYGVIAFSIEL
jgi:hypothetical protein